MYTLLIFLLFSINISAQILNEYDINNPSSKIELQKELDEISGLCTDFDDRVFAHNDEEGTLFELDINSGKIIKEFALKDKPKEDFEGIAFTGKNFFLVSSNGDLYKFNEEEEKEEVDFEIYKTKLKSKHDVEGLCFDPKTNSLLLACKEYADENMKDVKGIYSFSLENYELSNKPIFTIDKDLLANYSDEDKFMPSGIEYNHSTDTFFLIGGKGLLIIELNRSGKIIAKKKLAKGFHHQPEGITFLKNGTLLISDEKNGNDGRVTVYEKR